MAGATLVLPITDIPADYHWIVSPSLSIPSDSSVPIPVGLLACQRDPLLSSLETAVVSATLLRPSPPSSSKKGAHTKQGKASSIPTFPYPVLQLVLHDTILFPEGGGQPTDIGILTSEDGVTRDVELVKRHGGVAVHYVKSVEDISDVPNVLAPGKQVSLELGHAGFQRRLDHMSLHTAQHLLSSVIDTRLKAPTLTWSLTPWPSPAYVDLPRPLTAAEISQAQDEVNRHVFEGRRVHVEVDELRAGQAGIDTGGGGSGSVVPAPSSRELGRGLPGDYSGGVHRMVIIDGVDRTPCCGTHLPTLSTLQLFLFPSPSSSSATSFRHYFLAGPRLLNHLSTVQSLLTRTSSILSCGPPETPDRVALVVEESKRREKRGEDLERELAGVLGRQLADEMEQWRAAGGGGEWVRYVGRTDDSPTVRTFLQAVTLAFEAHLPGQDDTAHRFTLLLVSSPASQTSSSTTVVMLFGSEENRVKAVGEELNRQFKTLKGGGKDTRWSGKFVGVWLADREGKTASALLPRMS